jgi:hypothetical protein
MGDAELSAVDFLMVEFPHGTSTFPGEVAAEVASLVENGIVRILDLFVLSKDARGAARVLDLEDLEEVVELSGVPHRRSTVLTGPQLDELAELLAPGTNAGVIVWEHLWAAPFDAATQRSGGHLVASGRVPPEALAEAS